MTRDLSRLLIPKSLAVVGGGAWCEAIIGAARRIGFQGDIFPVHPAGKEIAGLASFRSLADWPGEIDAAFVGVNREATVKVVDQLAELGAGGAVAFASGFSEAKAELADGADLQAGLLAAAGEMPVLGPNCYGFVNALDRAAVWPDQHGLVPVDRGVAILTQSSNIAINLTMQKRGLPIGLMMTCGNQAQVSQSEIALSLLDDPRVTSIGLHIEGFGDLAGWEKLAEAARRKGVPLVVLKVGASDQAQAATISHTASLAGSDAGAQAFLDRLGIARAASLPVFLEVLKIFHVYGHLPNRQIASISCSGGEASLMADLGAAAGLEFPALSTEKLTTLGDVLGPRVALANPLDYHTYIWRDAERMAAAWGAMTDPDLAMTFSVLDYPRADRGDPSDWDYATEAAIQARADTDARFGVVASLPELMPEDVADRFMAEGVVPFAGMEEALTACALAVETSPSDEGVVWAAEGVIAPETLSESAAKAELAGCGLVVPKNMRATGETLATHGLSYPVVLKGEGAAHKSEAGLVAVGLADDAAVLSAAAKMDTQEFLIEEMVTGGVAELLIGVTVDPAHGYVLTLAAGGVLTELLRDRATLLLPTTPSKTEAALRTLRLWPALEGYRGKPGADIAAIVSAVMAVQDYVGAHRGRISEVEINPLICTPDGAIAVDALIAKG